MKTKLFAIFLSLLIFASLLYAKYFFTKSSDTSFENGKTSVLKTCGENMRESFYGNALETLIFMSVFSISEPSSKLKVQEDFLEATINNDLEGVKKYLKQGADVNGTNIYDKSPLMVAAFLGNIDVVNFLLDNGADINYKKEDSDIAILDTAIIGFNADVAKTLIKKGANLFGKKDDNVTLELAITTGDYELIQMLFEKGIKIIPKDDETPMILLAIISDECNQNDNETAKMVKLLLQNGADVNTTNNPASSPLILATVKGYIEVVKILLANGADKTKKDNLGKTALDIAKENENKELVELLEKE